MSILHFRVRERRRTVRVNLSVALTVHGQNESGEKFRVQVHSESVNATGALLQMNEVVVLGQTLVLANDNGRRTAECRVVSVRHERDGKTYVGVEFTTPDPNFWHMAFPLPNARPLRRTIPPATKVSA